ncbi:MAG: nucleoside monophosphate kinase [Candidatus Pacebacteria bacterium]|nr:nucleoside monophosphate kinase [Candidatus Paceibacterota bacterium]
MNNKAYIFIGRSGCGKGTQVDLLVEELKKEERDIFSLGTGDKFRKFAQGDNYSNKLSSAISEQGDLQPEFLAVLMWASTMVENVQGNEDFVLDGVPRKMAEATILDSALKFYGFRKPILIFMNVSRKWSEERLAGRGRSDDDINEIKKRLDWYDTEVAPVVEWYRNNSDYRFLDINGEQTIEEVHREIIGKLNK